MPESGVTKHNYLFCQFVNPARGHEGDRCDCFDTPSQRRTTLAKQRLARLRAEREVNRASTSNNTESAVASDPAVTSSDCPLVHSTKSAPNLDPVALTILVIVNTSLVVVSLVLASYLVHLLRRALQVQVYPI